jgi:hypothetical protein
MNKWHLDYPSEFLRPWKLFTLATGITLLVFGSFYFPTPDWDIPISFIMGILTYLTAPWCMRVLLEGKWRLLPIMLFFTWVGVDGSYTIYWHFKNPSTLELMRSANFPVSLACYCLCGLMWLYRGSLSQLFSEIRGCFIVIKKN